MEWLGNRQWMYNRVSSNRVGFTDEFMNGVEQFVANTSQLQPFLQEGKICSQGNCKYVVNM